MLCSWPVFASVEVEQQAFIEQMMEMASLEIGYAEGSGGYTKYSDWAGSNKYGEWCSEFVSWCVDQADQQMGSQYLNVLYPLHTICDRGVDWFKARGRYVTATGALKGYGKQWLRATGVPLSEQPYVPQRGDLIYFEWYQYNRIDHVGIVEQVSKGPEGEVLIHTIEGNNPDMVDRFTYKLEDPSIRGYGVTGDTVGTELREGNKGPIVQALQESLAAQGYFDGQPDGTYGAKTKAAVRAVQAAHGLEQTGVADQATQEALGFMQSELPQG